MTQREIWLAALLEFLAKYCSVSWAGALAVVCSLAFVIGAIK
jgi:hypothetical protein